MKRFKLILKSHKKLDETVLFKVWHIIIKKLQCVVFDEGQLIPLSSHLTVKLLNGFILLGGNGFIFLGGTYQKKNLAGWHGVMVNRHLWLILLGKVGLKIHTLQMVPHLPSSLYVGKMIVIES